MMQLKLPSSYCVEVSRSESLVAALGRNVVLASLDSHRRIGSWHPLSNPSHSSLSHSESQLAVKSTSGEIVILSTADGSVLSHHKPAIPDEGANILFSASDSNVVDASWSGFIRVRSGADLGLAKEYSFPGEMITSVSSNLDRSLWLFLHTTRLIEGARDKPPYISVWQWPLSSPHQLIVCGFSIAYCAAISPCARFLAVLGYNQLTGRTELHLKDLSGNPIAATPISQGGTGSIIRWSADSGLLATVTAEGFAIFEASTLQPVCTLLAEYPSDIAFIDHCKSLVVGTWKSGWLQPMGSNA